MSYRAGIGPGLEKLGWTPGPPQIICDGCDTRMPVVRVPPPSWFLDGKAPRGWQLIRNDDGTRTDFCPKCRASGPGKGESK